MLSKYRHLEIADSSQPEPGPGEVLVRVAACGICGSDVPGYDGSSGRRIPPIVMGHEASGRIAGVGEGVSGLAEGDRVTFDSTMSLADDWGKYGLTVNCLAPGWFRTEQNISTGATRALVESAQTGPDKPAESS